MKIDNKFKSAQRKHAREYWRAFADRELEQGDRIEVTSDTGMHAGGVFSEVAEFNWCDDSHLHCVTERAVQVGLPTCYIVGIQILDKE